MEVEAEEWPFRLFLQLAFWDSSKAQLGENGGDFGKQPVLPLCRAASSVGLGPSDSLIQWTC